MNEFKVAVLSPYLSRDLSIAINDEEFAALDEELEAQTNMYGDNILSRKRFLKTEDGKTVNMVSPVYIDPFGLERRLVDCFPSLDGASLVISGSSEGGEEEVYFLRDSGLIVGRYSLFYGGNSLYSGNSPEEGGYSLDFPKDVETVKKFLKTKGMLDAVVSREENRIREGIELFNIEINRPVLVTDYLRRALSIAPHIPF